MSEPNKKFEFKCEIVNAVYESDGFNLYACMPVLNKRDKSKDFFDDNFASVEELKREYGDIKFNKYGNVTLQSSIPLTQCEYYTIVGYEIKDNKYGYQYKVESYKTDIPKDINQLELFLNNILDSEAQTKEVLREYPNIIDLVMDNREDEIDVSKLHNIGNYRKQVMVNKIRDSYVLMDVISEFAPFGLSISSIRSLYAQYKDIGLIKKMFYKDPYKFLMQLDRVGFKKADAIILKKLPELRSSLSRTSAYIDKLLMDNENMGHTIIKLNKLQSSCRKDIPKCIEWIDEAVSDDRFIMIKEYVMRRKTFEAEQYVSEKLIKIKSLEQIVWEYDLKDINKDKEFELTDEQLGVINHVLNNNFTMLTGGGGVGKTFTLKTLAEILTSINKTAIYMAPTGKASKVMSGYINRGASTIHRGLKYNPAQGWGINESNPLTYDIVVVDEISMVDINLMRHLLEAIDIDTTKILLIGDEYQIPSVGAGNVAHNLIDSNLFDICRLTKVFRYKEGGLAKVNSDIRNGNKFYAKLNKGLNKFGESNDFSLINVQDENMNKTVLGVYDKLIKSGVNYNDVVISMALNKGDYGSKAINQIIQRYLIKNTDLINSKKHVESFNVKYHVGDIVMQIQNNYKVPIYEGYINDDGMTGSVFNGNTGVIKDIVNGKKDKKYVIIDFDGQLYYYEKYMLSQLVLGYAVNIYKLQGSQFPYVILSTPQSHIYHMNRNLMYTGTSRAQKQCFHISNDTLISSALRKSAQFQRNTLLPTLLKKYNIKYKN